MKPSLDKACLAGCLLAAACGQQAPWLPDSGERSVDAGESSQAFDSGIPDAGASLEVGLTSPSGPRRGPVLIHASAIDRNGNLGAVVLQREFQGQWVAASLVAAEQSGSNYLFVWDSFADAPFDGTVNVRVLASDPDGDVASAPAAVQLHGAPDTTRIVMVAHKLRDSPGGGATSDGNGVTAFVWSGPDGGVLGQPKRLQVGSGPSLLRAAPHGRATVVLESTAGTVSLLETPLDGTIDGTHLGPTLTLPYGTPADARWSPDGRFLYVAGSSGSSVEPAMLWRFEPSEDLASVGAPVALFELPTTPMHFDVDSTTGRLLVACGAGSTGVSKLLLVSSRGAQLARLDIDLGVPSTVAIAPDGQTALTASSLFGDQLLRFDLGANSLGVHGPALTSVRAPTDIVFYPDRLGWQVAALVSNLDGNSVTPLLVTASGVTPGAVIAGIPLAAEMDRIERGTQTGTVFVVSLSSVYRLTLNSNGVAQNKGKALQLPSGTSNIAFGLAVQR